MTSTISTYLFEKNALLREGLKSFLAGTEFKVAAEFKCMSETDSAQEIEAPHLLIIGISRLCAMPGGAKFPADLRERIHALREKFPRARVVLLISQEELADIPDIYSWSVDSFILRDASPDAFVSYLKLAMMGEKVLPAPMVPIISNGYGYARTNGLPFSVRSSTQQLSAREVEIIKCLVQGDSNKLIAQHLHIAEATVKVHLKTILRKLGVHNRTQVALWAVNHGFDSSQAQAGNDTGVREKIPA